MSEHTPTPIPIPIHHGSPSGFDLARGHVSIVKVIAIVVAAVSLAVSGAGLWFKAEAHSGDGARHVDPVNLVAGGGLAYKADVRAIRDLLLKVQILCAPEGKGFSCRLELP